MKYSTFKPNFALAIAFVAALPSSTNKELSNKVIKVAKRIIHKRSVYLLKAT